MTKGSRWFFSSALLALAVAPAPSQPSVQQVEIQRLSIEDRQKMMDLLHITSLRLGPTSRNEPQPGRLGVVNYDESKANPYPTLPDPLTLKNGKRVTSAKMWWEQRRPEIVEDFDREVYGRMPKVTPKVNWEVISTTRGMNGDVAIVTKQLAGHVDNASYPQVNVDIQLTLSTPADAIGPVPVIMEFGGGFRFPPGRGPTTHHPFLAAARSSAFRVRLQRWAHWQTSHGTTSTGLSRTTGTGRGWFTDSTKALPMPGDDRLGFDDDQHGSRIGPGSGQPRPGRHGPKVNVGRFLPEHRSTVDLVPQRQDLYLESSPRTENREHC